MCKGASLRGYPFRECRSNYLGRLLIIKILANAISIVVYINNSVKDIQSITHHLLRSCLWH